jgi:uncharacterized protein (TIGR02996 family)
VILSITLNAITPMTTAATDFDALWAAVPAAPMDQAPKLILADYLEERGRDPHLARGLRWCAANGKWPVGPKYQGKKTKLEWTWYYWLTGAVRACELPGSLWRIIAGRRVGIANFGYNDAMRADILIRRLGSALRKWKP